MRVCIVGGGIAGLCASIAFRRIGAEVSVHERACAPAEVGAGISLWINALRALDHLGCGAAVKARGQPVTHGEFRLRRGARLGLRYAGPELEALVGGAPVILMIHRAELVDALLAHAGEVRFGSTFAGLTQDAQGVTVRFEGAGEVRADLLVGADGARSRVREALLADGPPRYAGYTCWRGIASGRDVAPGYICEAWGRGERFGITTLPEGRQYWWATATRPADPSPDPRVAEVRRRFASWADPVPRLLDATPDDAILRHDIHDRPVRAAWAQGRCVLIGDAAHPTTPNLGQGGCLAIEDALALARRVSGLGPGETDHDPLVAALRGFWRDRRGRVRSAVGAARRLGWMGQRRGALTCAVRDTLFAFAPKGVSFAAMLRFARHDAGPLPDVPTR